MAMNPAAKALRISKLHPSHQTVLSALSGTGQTAAQVAAAAGTTADDAEKKLSVLVDEGLAARTVGSRTTALYTAV